MKNTGIFLSLLFVLSCCNLLQGQDSAISLGGSYEAGVLLNQKLRELEEARLRRQIDNDQKKIKEEKEAPKAEPETPDVPDVKVLIKKLEITPDSQLLTASETMLILKDYEDREVSAKELYEAVNKINNLYISKGFVASRAFLPPQKIENNMVKIQIVEGKVGSVNVENNKYTHSSFIKKHLNIKSGDYPNLTKINRRLQSFNSNYSTKVQIRMVAGKEPLTTDFYIVTGEPKRNQYSFFVDNTGGESTGKWRYGLNYVNNGVTGKCDPLNLTTMFSSNSKTAAISYAVPINSKGTKINLGYSANNLKIAKGDMALLNVKGKSKNYNFGITHPLKASLKTKRDLTFEYRKQKSETTIFGNPFVDDRNKTFAFGFSSLHISEKSVFYYKPSYVIDKYNGLSNSKNIKKILLEMLWQKVFNKGCNLTLRFNGQRTIGNEYQSSNGNFYLGGLYSVRGYKDNCIGGNSGVNIKADLRIPLGKKGRSNFVAFYDWGKITDHPILESSDKISSYGFGFEQSIGKRTTASIYVAYPKVKTIGDEEADSHKIYFSMNTLF